MCDTCSEINGIVVQIGPQGPAGPTGSTGPTGSQGTSGGTVVYTNTTGAVTSGTVKADTNIFSTVTTLTTSNTGTNPIAALPILSLGTTGDYILFNDTTTAGYGIYKIASVVNNSSSKDFHVTYVTGSGTFANGDIIQFAINKAGPMGATGSTGSTGSTGTAGVSSFTTMTGNASFSSGTYTLPVANSTSFSVGQIIYVASAGYYIITAIPSNVSIKVTDPGYPGNSSAALLNTAKIVPAGIIGATGLTGPTGASGYIYETVDGNHTPALATDANQILMRNDDNTGYVFVSLSTLQAMLNALT